MTVQKLRLSFLSSLFAALGISYAPAADQPAQNISFVSPAKGNVFAQLSGTVALRIPAGDPVVTGTVLILNERGETLRQQIISNESSEVPIALDGKGFYQVAATVSFASGKSAKATTTAAVVGPLLEESVRSQSRFGLWTVQGDKELILSAGARWNRAMTTLKDYPPEFVQPDTPAVSPTGNPPADLKGFTYVGNISFGLPLWLYDTVPDNEKKGFAKPFQAPKDWHALSDLVEAFVRKHPTWSEFPACFELYNEPEWHWKGSNEDLVRFEITVADAIKRVRPDVKVLGPGFSSIRIKDPARLDLETVHRLGLFDHMDGLVVHAYVDGSAPEELFIQRVQELQAFLARIGRPNFPIHLTEFGWCTKPGTWQRPVDEITQAQYVTRSLSLLAAAGVENATYFCLLFKAAPNEGERSFSLLHDDSTPKPGYAAFATVARWLANIQGKGRWLHLTPSTNLLVFRKGQKDVGVLWDTEGARNLTLPGGVVKAEDMTGRAVAIDGQKSLSISQSPVFLELADAGVYDAGTLAPLQVMRGNEVPLATAAGSTWSVPAPLQVQDGKLSAPQDAPKGAYLMLAQSGTGWVMQPVEVITPLEVTPAQVQWPAGDASPRFAAQIRSHAQAPLPVLASSKLEGVRRTFSQSAELAPGASQQIIVPLNDLRLGQRYRGSFSVESRENGKRDVLEQPSDVTLVSAAACPRLGSPDWNAIPPMDFSAWDPFGVIDGPNDCSATLQAAHDSQALYLRICIRDNDHLQNSEPEKLWSQDGIQLGFDADAEKTWEANDLFGLKGHRIFEYGVGWDGKRPLTWRWVSYSPELPVGQSEPRMGVAVQRKEGVTDYRIRVPWQLLGLTKEPPTGSPIGLAIAVSDSDSGKPGRRGVRLFGGITDGKDPMKYGKLWLR